MLNRNGTETNAVTASTQPPLLQFISFCLAEQRYAFPIATIQEIVVLQAVSITPQVPHYVEGLTNLRGSIVPVVNLRSLFGLPKQPHTVETRMIVAKVANRTIGCTVDSVSQVLRTSPGAIQDLPESWIGPAEQYITGVISSNEEFILLLDVVKLFDLKRLNEDSHPDKIRSNLS